MTLSPEERDGIVAIVRDVSRREITPFFRALTAADIDAKSAPDDLVTVADKAAERALSERFSALLPDASIVGEEAISADRSLLDRIGEPGRCVIIDPIDGTWNYASGIATYGVIIAVVENGETVFGLLYDPSFDDWIWAAKGNGAHYTKADGHTERLVLAAPPSNTSELFGFVGLYLFEMADRQTIAAELAQFRRTMTLRCSCHEYRQLAQGNSNFCLNGMLNPWDHAAGVLIYQEAGGIARLLDGREYVATMTQGHLLTAQSEELWQKLRRVFELGK